MTNASEELTASVFERRRFLCNLACMYQTLRCDIPEDHVIITQTDGVLQPTPGLISKVLKVTVHHLRQKERISSEYRLVSLQLKFLGVVLSRQSVCLLQVSLCDEYSLPVDFVNKRRPHSFGARLANWTTPSPNGEQVTEIFS